MADTANGYWVRVTKRDGSDQTLWCVRKKERALEVYGRELAKAEDGDLVEWGEGQ